MKKFVKLTAHLVIAVMLSTMCATPASADSTTLNERFIEAFDYATGTVSSISDVAETNKYSSSAGGEIIENPYDSTLGTSMKWASGDWRSQWSYSSGWMIKLSATKMVISLKAALPEAGTAFQLKIAPRYEGDAENFSVDRGTGDILRIASDASTGAITATTGGPRTSLGTLELAKMYEFTVVINNPDDADTLATYDVYVDGVLAASGINYYNGTYGPSNGETYGPFNIDGIRYIQGSGGGAIMDDIRVYSATASDITESLPENGATNISVDTNSIDVEFETDVAADQMTTDNVSVSNATVSSIDRINNRNYRINLGSGLASKTEYAVSFGNATDVLGNAITDTITFTSEDPDFVPTMTTGPQADFNDKEAGTYAGAKDIDGDMFSSHSAGDAGIELKTNTLDASLENSAYITSAGYMVTYWEKKNIYEWYTASKAGERIVVNFKCASPVADTTYMPSMYVVGYTDTAGSATFSANVARNEAAGWKTGGTRPVIMSSIEADKIYDINYVFITGEAGSARYDVYVDGVLMQSQNVCSSTGSTAVAAYSINYVQFQFAQAGVMIDDLKVYTSDGMAIQSTIPADGASAAKVKNYVTVETSTPIDFTDTSAVALSNLGNVTKVEKVDGHTANIYFDAELAYETKYETKISGLKDLLGHTLTAGTISFTTAEYTPYDIGSVAFTQNGNSVTAVVDVTNNGATELTAALIVAVYRGNLLIATDWASETIETTASVTTTVSFTPEDGKTAADYTVRAYVWEDVSISNITPLTEPSSFTLS